MPDDRLFHKRLGHSAKVNQLTDFEDLVWRGYVLSADDFGVMRFSAITLQADHDRFDRRAKAVQRALERVRDVGLVKTFEHQDRVYCAQRDWQDYQHIKHARTTINPKPPEELLRQFSPKTRALFQAWPGKRRETVPEDFSNPSEEFIRLAGAGARETANGLRQEAHGSEGGVGETALAERAGNFCEWYGETYQRLEGVGYIGNPQKDYLAACLLCQKLSDQDMRDAALVWFGMDDDFARNGTRTIPKFASRASDCLLRARKVGA